MQNDIKVLAGVRAGKQNPFLIPAMGYLESGLARVGVNMQAEEERSITIPLRVTPRVRVDSITPAKSLFTDRSNEPTGLFALLKKAAENG